jgi:hypothetical protein
MFLLFLDLLTIEKFELDTLLYVSFYTRLQMISLPAETVKYSVCKYCAIIENFSKCADPYLIEDS